MSLPKPPLGPPVRRDSLAVLVVVGAAVHHLGGLLGSVPDVTGGLEERVLTGVVVLAPVVHVVVALVVAAVAFVGVVRALPPLEERLRRTAAAPDVPAPDPAG